jgi:putative lipoprotein
VPPARRSIVVLLAALATLLEAPVGRADSAGTDSAGVDSAGVDSVGVDSVNVDPWFGRDKLIHFAAAGSLAVVGYANASMLTESRPARAGAGAALAIGAGVAKELWDLDGHGDASWRDLGWDVIGAATGVLISAGVDWAIHRMFHPPGGRTR